MSSVSQVETAIRSVFERADERGQSSGFVQRRRKFTGQTFAGMLVLGLLQRGEVSLSDLAHFARHLNVEVSPQGIDERMGETCAKFLQELLNGAFTQVVSADPVALPLLQRFAEVVVEDSNSFCLPDDLKDVWKGCGGSSEHGTQAGFKIQVRWDLLEGGFKGLALQDGRTPDTRSALRECAHCAKRVRIHDLGYFDTLEFQHATLAEEYFLTRFKVGSTLLFTAEGEPLDLLAVLQEKATQGSLTCQVQVSATRHLPARLLAIPVPEEVAVKRQTALRRKAQKHGRSVNERLLALSHWTILLTNLSEEELSIPEALVLLRLRWQIELLFKLWKQEGQVDTSRSTKPWHILCDIYAKLLGMLIVHWLMIVGCWQIPSRSMVKAARAIRSQIVLLAKALGGKLDWHWVLCEITDDLDGCRMNARKKSPNAYQLLLSASPPTPSGGTSVLT